MKPKSTTVMMLALILGTSSLALQRKDWSQVADMDKLTSDESHCLTLADMRGDKDMPISCFCRDAIADARYVYFTYILGGKDRNLNGVFLRLEQGIGETCGPGYDSFGAATQEEWKWNGPEVVRTYPSEAVIERIKPETRDGHVVGYWVPFTMQLVYRDAQGRVTRTENYSSRELVPILPRLDLPKPPPRKGR